MADQVEFRVMDYRDLRRGAFDAVASIGMVEHVGEAQINEYARQIAAVLEPGGRVLNHGIAAVRAQERRPHRRASSRTATCSPTASCSTSRACCGLRARRLRDRSTSRTFTPTTPRRCATGRPRFEEHLDEAERLAGPERIRVWRLYLRAARNCFETANNAVYQLLCSSRHR